MKGGDPEWRALAADVLRRCRRLIDREFATRIVAHLRAIRASGTATLRKE